MLFRDLTNFYEISSTYIKENQTLILKFLFFHNCIKFFSCGIYLKTFVLLSFDIKKATNFKQNITTKRHFEKKCLCHRNIYLYEKK